MGSDPRPKVALVLGAGGVRGCAHGGVIEVLAEAGFEIDIVVGASIGAIVGLALAADLPAAEIGRNARETTSLELLRFYAGRLHPTHHNPISRKLFQTGEGKNFEDLPRKFAVVATNIETGEPEVLSSGPVLPAIQASIALPLIARAVNVSGKYYLDGGICDTVPVWAARELGADKVIGVHLGETLGPPNHLRGLRAQSVLRRIGRQRKPICGSWRDQIRFGCRQLSATQTVERGQADVMIQPDFEGLSPNSMYGAAFSYWKGVDAARAALPEISRLVVMPSTATTAAVRRHDLELRPDEVVRGGDLNPASLQSLGGLGIDY